MKVVRTAAPVRKQTAKNIREAIMNGQFAPGQRLIERGLCELTGVSRTTVREALRQLETEGFIKLIPQKGPYVARMSLNDSIDIYQVRKMLESLACKLYAEKIDSTEIGELSNFITRMEEASNKNDIKGYLSLKDAFYETILLGCGNKTVMTTLKGLHNRIASLRLTSLSKQGRIRESFTEMKSIFRALKKRDPEMAWDVSVEHVINAEAAVVDSFRKNEMEN